MWCVCCLENVSAYYPTVSVDPVAPEVSDTVVVTITGAGPDLCWRLEGVQDSVANDTFFYTVQLSNGDCPGGCLADIMFYSYVDTLGILPQGAYIVNVFEHNDPTCWGPPEDTLIETSFLVGDSACVPCIAGDANSDESVNIADVTHLIMRIFTGGVAADCCQESDVNGSGEINIADITFLIARIFSGGPAPVCGPAGMGC